MAHKRLKLIASLINKDERVLDVGTDHCFVPIFLLKNNITTKLDASDIAEKPLSFAKNNLIKNGFENKVNLILSNGFEKIDTSNYDVIIIAGMGGITISNILSSKKFKGRYIIHSTTSLEEVRKTIENVGMTIINEIILKEGKIFNVIIEAKLGKSKLSEKEIYMGPSLLQKDINHTKDYYSFLLKTIIKNSKESNNKELKKKERIWLEETLWKNKS